MKKLILVSWLTVFLLSVMPLYAEAAVPFTQQQMERSDARDGVYTTQGYRSGRGGYRPSPSPGVGRGAPTAPGVTPAPRPTTPGPGYAPGRGGGLGGLFGGFAAGAILGSLLNPFGIFGGGGYGTAYGGILSLLGLVFWAVVGFFLVRWFIRARRRTF